MGCYLDAVQEERGCRSIHRREDALAWPGGSGIQVFFLLSHTQLRPRQGKPNSGNGGFCLCQPPSGGVVGSRLMGKGKKSEFHEGHKQEVLG